MVVLISCYFSLFLYTLPTFREKRLIVVSCLAKKVASHVRLFRDKENDEFIDIENGERKKRAGKGMSKRVIFGMVQDEMRSFLNSLTLYFA